MGGRLRWDYKEIKSFEERLEEAQRIKLIYEDCVPIIVQRFKKTSLTDIERKKFIVERSQAFSLFYYRLRKQIKLESNESLFLMLSNGISPSLTSTIGQIYDNHSDSDQFLYVCYTNENTFGGGA